MSVYDAYEPVIGLEVHIQLLTRTKAYSADANDFGALPNSNVSPVSLGLPGTLPVVNRRQVEFAVKLGLAVGSDITLFNHFARKNYFYADLPKGYQITQDKTPICTGGKITLRREDGTEKHIRIHRIHMEEDAGKSIHDQDPTDTLIDLNRAGVPLLEMVSEADLRSSEEAYAYLTEVRKLVRYLDICDGNMEEGSMRCDANISVRKKGTEAFGRKVEVKNMNSIRNVQRAIEYEVTRQIDLLEKGGTIVQETRSFDAADGTTFSLRTKEDANDYRYFPEPDLQPVVITPELIEKIRSELPPLPHELFLKYTGAFGLSSYDAGVLTDQKGIALFFEDLLRFTPHTKQAANWIMGPVKSWMNETTLEINNFPIAPEKLASLIGLVEKGTISHSAATQKLFPALLKQPAKNPDALAVELNLIQQSDQLELRSIAEQAIAKYPEKVQEYKSGKTGLVGLFMGELMKLSKGKADPKLANKILTELLNSK
ncbi:MAG: Asp-tRNA(Asn)/Glu-tRNA(Gln) amidotransferase subunit GatB [Bacteroidia bacterium]|nr:Asp-tRNA(Asn)/Glu-tRNA(Gln) amidotransferase subunit GatB [Bacteroidia bacterium]